MDNDMGKLYDHLQHDPNYWAELEIWEISASEGCTWDEAIDRWKDRQNIPFANEEPIKTDTDQDIIPW